MELNRQQGGKKSKKISKKRLSKKRLSKKRLSKKRVSKKINSKKRLCKRGVCKKGENMKGGRIEYAQMTGQPNPGIAKFINGMERLSIKPYNLNGVKQVLKNSQ